jgi:hypothetical protein
MSDASVAKKTGRTWKEWVSVLDRGGAAKLAHPKIASLLHEEHGLTSWWAQTVTVGYERIRGLREKGQKRDGTFAVNKSKVYPVSLEALWKGFCRCDIWLEGAKLRMSKATKHKTMHMRWADGTPVDVGFVSKGPAKSQVALSHSKLATRAEAARLRTFWAERLCREGARRDPPRPPWLTPRATLGCPPQLVPGKGLGLRFLARAPWESGFPSPPLRNPSGRTGQKEPGLLEPGREVAMMSRFLAQTPSVLAHALYLGLGFAVVVGTLAAGQWLFALAN